MCRSSSPAALKKRLGPRASPEPPASRDESMHFTRAELFVADSLGHVHAPDRFLQHLETAAAPPRGASASDNAKGAHRHRCAL
jgi:hypothetical protein